MAESQYIPAVDVVRPVPEALEQLRNTGMFVALMVISAAKLSGAEMVILLAPLATASNNASEPPEAP
jgi:hypothetical protein